jgi:hypothetical protein
MRLKEINLEEINLNKVSFVGNELEENQFKGINFSLEKDNLLTLCYQTFISSNSRSLYFL